MLDAFRQVVQAANFDDHVEVFTRGVPINIELSHVLELERMIHFQPRCGSITRLRARDADTVGVISVNESGHHAWSLESEA